MLVLLKHLTKCRNFCICPRKKQKPLVLFLQVFILSAQVWHMMQDNEHIRNTITGLKNEKQVVARDILSIHKNQIHLSLQVGEIQGALDSHQNSRIERQLFLVGWWTEYRQGSRGIHLIPGPLRDRMIKRIQQVFEDFYHWRLEVLEVSHHYPQGLNSSGRTLSPRTLISVASREDAKALQRLLSREHLWTQDPKNIYRSTRIYAQKVLTKREQRLQLPINLIAQCIICHMWKRQLDKPDGKNFSWEHACQRFRTHLYMHSDGRSLRQKKPVKL